jgi:hypothetical protein
MTCCGEVWQRIPSTVRIKSLGLIKYVIETYDGVKVRLYVFLNSALNGDVLSPSRPGRFTAREIAPITIG